MGASQFEYTDSGAQTFTCDLHVQGVTVTKNRPTYPNESLDGTVITVVSVGSGQNQATVTISAERDRTGLRDLRDALVRGISQTFTPDLDSPLTTFTCTAVPGTVGPVVMESEGAQSPRYAMTVTLRRLDGGAFDP